MSSNILTLTKWMPIEIKNYGLLFVESIELETSTLDLLTQLINLLNKLEVKKRSKHYYNICGETHEYIQDIEDVCTALESIVVRFNAVLLKLKNTEKLPVLCHKSSMFIHKLWLVKLKISYLLSEFIGEIAYLFVYYGERFLVLTLRISTSYNELLAMDNKYSLIKTTSVCNNTCPYLMFPLRKISVTRLLQILAQNRAEICCHKLIDCLLDNYKQFENNSEDDTNSDNSSLEIYMALTKHMSPTPTSLQKKSLKTDSDILEIEDSGSFGNLEELILYEEKNVVELLLTTLKCASAMLGTDGVKKSKNSTTTKVSAKAKAKVIQYYEQILWGEVGNYLEHVVLWWAASPLSARPPHSSHHLREWITQFLPSAEIPGVVLSALSSLADALGVHVTSTSWDKNFRLALVASKTTCNVETGKLFSVVLQDLVNLANQCEITPDWIIGAPLDELPLVEQIPVLHRLDHSVHTTRLWAINESKKIANTWNVSAFFDVTHKDVVNCMSQLNNLRLTDHSIEIEKGGLGVQVEVCAMMRAKLASEVKTNVDKLKDTPNECVGGLAAVCRTNSLANLQMIFPKIPYWKAVSSSLPETPSPYVEKFLDQILKPVLAAINDHHIGNMILTLMCEAWLDHIYMNKIKFSQHGAVQLLCDFDHITTWIKNCTIINDAMKKKLIKNEILKRCEGVGRILLRNPGEKIKMMEKKNRKVSISDRDRSPTNTKSELMPAEMYVPNQEQWLELRAGKKKAFFKPALCCGQY